MKKYIDWLKKNKIVGITGLDTSGIPRGKILPTSKFLNAVSDNDNNIEFQKFFE